MSDLRSLPIVPASDLPAVLRREFRLAADPVLVAEKVRRASRVLVFCAGGGLALVVRVESRKVVAWFVPDLSPAAFAAWNGIPLVGSGLRVDKLSAFRGAQSVVAAACDEFRAAWSACPSHSDPRVAAAQRAVDSSRAALIAVCASAAAAAGAPADLVAGFLPSFS